MKIVFALILGAVIGLVLTCITIASWIAGTLRIDSSDEDGPYLFLELDCTVNFLKKRKYVLFKVNPTNYISQN